MIYEVWLPTLITFCPHTAAIIYTHNFRCPPSSSLILERAQTNRPGITNSLRTSIEAEIFNDFDHSINGKMLDHYRSLQASNWPWFHMVRCTVDHFYAFVVHDSTVNNFLNFISCSSFITDDYSKFSTSILNGIFGGVIFDVFPLWIKWKMKENKVNYESFDVKFLVELEAFGIN